MTTKRPETCKGCYHLPGALIVACATCKRRWYADHTASIMVRTYLSHATTILCVECAPPVMNMLQKHGLIPSVRSVLADVMENGTPHADNIPVIE